MSKQFEGAASIKVCRGVRGATTASANTREEILAATREMLRYIIKANQITVEDVASAFFTTTADLNADYPALAARQLGWHEVALMCAHEMSVPHGLPMCIRVLIHWNTTKTPQEIHHIYLREAVHLRPDRKIELEIPEELEPDGFYVPTESAQTTEPQSVKPNSKEQQ